MSDAEISRLTEQQMNPRITALWQALQPLRTTLSFMNSGAHPDDETSAMLAALRFRDGVHISYVCANRGEGGQNNLGRENGAVLGALRTAEMERAAKRLNMRLYWLSESPDDTITDFGFSKSGEETLKKWGKARTLKRFVDIVRRERPDILCPTFLDVPGQHGHHRAMTRAVQDVMDLAADPDYPDSDLPIWQVKKLFLPAWGGGGSAYDDEVPPPTATHIVHARGTDPVTGFSWENIGQQSRTFHKSQGMGRWVSPEDERDWPLHLLDNRVADGPDLAAHIPATLCDLAALPGAEDIAPLLQSAQTQCDASIAAWPDEQAITTTATQALSSIRQARKLCPDALQNEVPHRLARLETALQRVIFLASDADARGYCLGNTLHVENRASHLENLRATALLPEGWRAQGDQITPGAQAALHDGYRDHYDPALPPLPALEIQFDQNDQQICLRLPLENPPLSLPAQSLRLNADRNVINLQNGVTPLRITLADLTPENAQAEVQIPDGWGAEQTDQTILLTPPSDLQPGLHTLPVLLNGQAARSVENIAYPHHDPTTLIREENIKIRVLDCKVPPVRVGYIGGGNDHTDHWLAAMGAMVTPLTDEDLKSPETLAQYDTILIGIFALGFRAGLVDSLPALHNWVHAGGTMITLYHRPGDNWDPEISAPAHLEIGLPSLRWRVTDENAAITHIAPDHPLLNTPNEITPDDWSGWHKERGLYFAKSWDAKYQPLLSLRDPGEPPHEGALLAAEIGKGRHIHCALILHHQMENLVPGAFRLMANLIAKR